MVNLLNKFLISLIIVWYLKRQIYRCSKYMNTLMVTKDNAVDSTVLVIFSGGLILNNTLKNVALRAGGMAHSRINSFATIPSNPTTFAATIINSGCRIFLKSTFSQAILVGMILKREIIKPRVNKEIPGVELPINSKLCCIAWGNLICNIAKIRPVKDRVINGVLNIFSIIFL